MQTKIVEALMIEFKPGEPILLDELSFDDVSDDALRQTMKRLVDRGKLERFDRGVYYYTEELLADGNADAGLLCGTQAPTAEEVIRRKYITNGEEVYGFWSGLTLENMMGVSTQMPVTLEVVSNRETSRRRKIAVGRQKLYVKKPRVAVTAHNYRTLMLLDVLNGVEVEQLDERERRNLLSFAHDSKLHWREVFSIAQEYPTIVGKRLIESGVADALA